jgi:hypothetical protein
MVETAITLGFSLLLLYGSMMLGLIGYNQLQLDGATFFLTKAYAEQYSATGTTDKTALDNAIGPVFPNVPVASASFSPAPAPSTNVGGVNYTPTGTTTGRFGGASVLLPRREQTSLSMTLSGQTWNGLMGAQSQPITINGGNLDARPTIGNRDDDTYGTNYNDQAQSFLDPIVGDDQNVPPYYTELAFMNFCFGGGPTGNNGNGHWDTCTTNTLGSIGLAEYMKDDNYSSSYTDSVDPGGMFYYMECHQYWYVRVANAMPATYQTDGGNYWDGNVGKFIENGVPDTTKPLTVVYSWDIWPSPPGGRLQPPLPNPLPVGTDCP